MRVLDDSIQVQTFSDAEALRAHYRDVRRRLKVPRPKPLPAPPIVIQAVAPIRLPAFLPASDADWMPVHDIPRITTRQIATIVVATFGVSTMELISHRRRVDIAFARQAAMWMLRRFTTQSFPEIGRRIGNRDHTTAIHAVRKIDRVIDQNGVVATHETPEAWALALRPFQPAMPKRWRSR